MSPNLGAMEDFTSVKGVFLYTKYLDSDVMVRCQQALLNNFPNIRFSSVIADEKFLGYRVHFSSPDEEAVLAKKHLTVSGVDIRICALTTCLTIHNINSDGKVQSDSDIRGAVNNRFGKLLSFVKIPGSPNRQNENIDVFRAHIDVPEIKDLRIFDHEGLPEMCISLPNKREKLKVAFFCRQCEKEGHIKEDCVQVIQRRSTAAERITSNNSGDGPTDSVMKIKIPQEWTDTYAEKIGREEIMKAGILSEGNLNDNHAGPSTSTPEVKESKKNLPTFRLSLKIKEEPEENASPLEIKGKIQTNENHNGTNVPKEETSSIPRDAEGSDSNSHLDDDIQFIGYRDSSNSANTPQTTPFKSERRASSANSDDDLNSPPSARPAEYTFFSSTVSATPGPSNATHGSARPSISVEVTTNLSVRLQECINRACEEIGVLSRKKLEAFLTHVKKKSNPIRVASNYTPHPLRLKQLLQRILDYYYDTPQTGTKEDIQFIKWLNGLVGRFEGTVSRKRKRGGLNQDDTPSKK